MFTVRIGTLVLFWIVCEQVFSVTNFTKKREPVNLMEVNLSRKIHFFIKLLCFVFLLFFTVVCLIIVTPTFNLPICFYISLESSV